MFTINNTCDNDYNKSVDILTLLLDKTTQILYETDSEKFSDAIDIDFEVEYYKKNVLSAIIYINHVDYETLKCKIHVKIYKLNTKSFFIQIDDYPMLNVSSNMINIIDICKLIITQKVDKCWMAKNMICKK